MLFRMLILFFAIFSYGKNLVDITLQLGWKFQFQFAGEIIAKEKGFYEEVGLNVKLQEWDGKTDIVNYVVNNKNVIATSTTSLIRSLANKKPIKKLIPTFQVSPLALAIVGYKDIKSLKDLETKKIPITDMIKDIAPIIAMFKIEKIDVSKLNFVHFDINDYLHKKGAYLIYSANEPYILEKRKIPYKIFDPKNYGLAPYGDILFTSTKFTEENPEAVTKFIEATKKGWRYALKHQEEAIKIILEKYNTQHKTYDELKYEAKVLSPLVGFETNKQRVINIRNVYLLTGLVDKSINICSNSFNPTFTPVQYKKFIKNHTITCTSTNQWAPFTFDINEKLSGIGVDYWHLVVKKANLKTKCVLAPTFTDALNYIKTKQADVILSTAITEDRKKYALFTKPYVSFPFVLATKNNVGFIEDFKILQNKVIAVGKNYTAQKVLEKYYPFIKLLPVKNTKEALKMVEKGKAFGAVDILPAIAYNINQYQFSTLKISGKLPYNFDVRFMIRNDYPKLVNILNSAIDSISKDEKNKISQKWVPIVYQKGISFEKLKKYVIIIAIIFSIFIIWIIFKEIKDKKREQLKKELIKAKEKAEQAAKAKSEFLANMSHEIRTPLNAMFGFIQILQDKQLDEESRKYLNIIEKSGENLLTIINDILDFSKLESGKLHIEKIEFNPKEEFEIIYNLFLSKAKEKNITLKLNIENLKYNIISDPTRLKQVIANLLSNAIKFTPQNKNITLTIKYNEKKEMLYIEVKDEGIGIAKNKLKTIFEAFSQADNSTTRKYGGTGLGLTISYRLIELLNGKLKVISKEDKGSRFYFAIPAKKGKLISQKEIKKEITDKKYNYHILLVEDNKANQLFMSVILKKMGITFDIANDGIEAVEKFKNNKYNFILMDENMPNMNGIEATKKIREIEKKKHLKPITIIALTANALAGDKEKFILAGMNYYLSKPLNIEKLKEILDKLKEKNVTNN